MKQRLYTINFKSGSITVQAFNYEQAQILAQSEAIQKGWDYTIVNKVDVNNLPKEFNFISNINKAVPMYHAVETESDYIVTSCDGYGPWHFDKEEIRESIIKNEYVIV